MTTSLLWFYGLFYGALGLGFVFRGWEGFSSRIMQYNILFIEAPIFIYSFWILNLKQVRQAAPVPLCSCLLVLLLLWLVPRWAKRLLPSRPAQGSFILASAFSNIGNTGGIFICYLLFGLPGLTLGALYLLPYPLLIFTLGFSLAKRWSSDFQLTWRDYLHNIFSQLISLIPLAAMGLGLAFNLAGWKPALAWEPMMGIMLKLNLAIACLSIGMTLKPMHFFSPAKPIIAASAIKFLGSPLLAFLLVLACYGSWQMLPAKVILVQSAMPPAIYAVVIAHLFHLDRDLVNALWISLTLLLIPVAAVLFLLFH